MAPSGRASIPEATVARLPLYHRCLLDLRDEGRPTVSSEQLADLAGVNAAKVRKDLSHFGSYGTRGVGYDVAHLLVEIASALNVDRDWPCVIVGAGNLGSALATFAGFTNRGFTVVGVLDVDPAKVGRPLGSLTVRHQDDLAELVAREGVAIGIVAVPPVAAQEAADRLVEVGITSILNFAPTVLDVPDHVQVRDVDLAVELQILAFHEDPSRRVGPTRTAG
ncbi:MAG TPA: redox-sensing transcriptional repressor Rex [Microthrixaceae bacterium]|nr:redox-sensing transcriptional repressor Rex [Microthrixaceae bacterium]RTL09176.1 MAG: redox-sensing transcriptional repressor Rex [Acidimicrobiia bacterium]MCB9376340.1 redox-sensing transcriptional repressor Rex [Microthrixaceae bacterium]MCB9401098.1 redox-sensing transcriptional repressor Rex [Microthrixaceae bacterium]MCC6183335.1 redox-sensing transcriptional repressor Rex [Microthrixaceae bacterium]